MFALDSDLALHNKTIRWKHKMNQPFCSEINYARCVRRDMHKSVHIYIAYNKLKNLLILKWSKSGGRENGILYSKKKDSLNLCTSM